jgi:3-keto-5-aminohexanoate cleavage enzyme
MTFVARKVIEPVPSAGDSAANWLRETEVVVRAVGTCVVPEASRRPEGAEGRPGPCIITAAIVGAETTREQTPHLPITPEEIGEEARRCVLAGASVIHLHVRDEAGRPSQDAARFRAAIAAIRARTDVIIQASTGGAVGMTVDERCGALALSPGELPEMATLNVGTINFGEDVFMNRPDDTREIARRIGASGCTPEIEVYDAGHLDIARDLIDRGLITGPLHFQFVLGVRGALGVSARNLDFLVESLPASASWGVAGVGRHQMPLADLALIRGGNVRVGLEDNIYLDKGVLAEGSAPLVARAASLAAARGRAIASVTEARQLLQLQPK